MIKPPLSALMPLVWGSLAGFTVSGDRHTECDRTLHVVLKSSARGCVKCAIGEKVARKVRVDVFPWALPTRTQPARLTRVAPLVRTTSLGRRESVRQ